MKNRMETLETLHDYTLEDIVRAEVKIRIHDGKADDDVLEGFERRSPVGSVSVTKKEYVAEQEKEIARLHAARETIEKMIEEEKTAG
ncbi:MAG: hypothetical protein RL141_800 [Candidatus Parcubacteria bacterium]